MRMKKKNMRIGSYLFILILGLELLSCRPRNEEATILETLAQMKDFKYKGKPVPPETIEEIKSTILMFEKKIEDAVKATGELGMYYKMLAKNYLEIEELKEKIAELKQKEKALTREKAEEGYTDVLIVEYVKQGMLTSALENLGLAIKINPENPILFYLAGNCAARLAKAMVSMDQQPARQRYFADAYAYYERACQLDPTYVDANKGMAVLLIFELGRAEEAEPYLKSILAKEKKNTEAMALLARVYFETEKYEDSIALYEQVAEVSTDKTMVELAKKNIKQIKDMMNELY
jgi:tetratricopeptide (TPR) repeat protein